MNESTGKLIAKIVEKLIPSEVREWLGDEIRFLRWKRTHRILDRAAEIYEARQRTGLPTPLPPGLAVRLLENASLEDDADLQELWSRLLANAADPEFPFDVNKTHVSMLSEMTPLDARVLAYFPTQGWNQYRRVAEGALSGKVLNAQTIATDLSTEVNDVLLSLGNLWRLGCLVQDGTWDSATGIGSPQDGVFRPSALGLSLLRAVAKDPPASGRIPSRTPT